jgi:hypothetical protein
MAAMMSSTIYERFGLHEAPSVALAEEAEAAARPKVPV